MMRRTPWALVLLAALLIAPLVVVLTAPLHTAAPQWDYVLRNILLSHTWETAQLLLISVGAALVFGTGTAWLVATTDFPLRNVFRWALVLPLALPTYISAITFAALFGPTGSFTLALGLPLDIVTLPGLGSVFALVLFPYVYLPARAAFGMGMGQQLEAARLLGARGLRRFVRIAVPLGRPAMAGGAFLVAMETLNDYGAVKYYGIHTLTAGIFRSWGGLYDEGSALRLSGVLLGLVALLLWTEKRARRNAGRTTTHEPMKRIRLQGWRAWAATGACALLLSFAFILPVGAIVSDALRTYSSHGLLDILPAMGHTLLIGTLAATATLCIAVVLAYAERHVPGGGRAAAWAGIGYVVPGAVIALGVMALAGAIANWTGVLLIGGLALLVYAFSVRFLALANQPLRAGLEQQPRAFDEAARLLGASPWRTFRSVNLPLLRPSLIAAALLVLMEVVKELPLTLILRPFDLDTLSTRVFELARIEQWPDAAVPALLIVLCGLVPVLLLDRLLDRSHR